MKGILEGVVKDGAVCYRTWRSDKLPEVEVSYLQFECSLLELTECNFRRRGMR